MTHVQRVQRLYRRSLKNLLNWCVHRDLWIEEGFKLRAEFDANKHLADARHIEKIVSAGEAKLLEYKHPDPYTIPTDFGGSKYMRYHANGKGYPEEVCEIPAYFK
mmetsp:Transcript_46601/g.77030  ORF Transcript_46601/g.77030 Transcript_46601/m.77030 type:complete len:105 (-) Transcript_46601:332-646(-)|eukprot:CAMPEP_0119338956 /NCGR_PEP_ID=MMETSP1333-20130426/97261_1 /TAXON_ID=418940 /ORGANISM="Scyphosphaera apsteinii, Strain RCC1455" /LENGTH=104 /DNA_ID=CAMNT_0007350379 /DNA_START=62 /DNA_END=376 /DNA_ORIENTATION=-